MIDRLCWVLRRIGNIEPINDRLLNFVASLTALTSLIFFKIQGNGHLRAKGVVILDTGEPINVPPEGHSILCER